MNIAEKQQTAHAELNQLYTEALELLSALIAIPSFSGSEQGTASEIASYLAKHGVTLSAKTIMYGATVNYLPSIADG